MSNPYKRTLSLAGRDFSRHSPDELEALVREVLERGIHGLCFSPYIEGQGPGTVLTERQIRDRLAIVAPHVRWIRTFSCTEGNEHIPAIAREFGLKTLIGVWLDDDRDNNARELANAAQIVKAGHADLLGVGNEVLLREDLAEDELIDCLRRARAECPGVPIGYVDAYFQFADHPRVTAECDVVFANCYPFWEGCPAELALIYMKEMYRRAVAAADGKPVVISETGWPDTGSPTDGAIPSRDHAIHYFLNSFQWAEEEAVELFWFAAFDEAWKVDKEGDVGAFWGLWDKDGNAKFC